MRYYDIKITDPASGALVREYTSYVNGQTDPGALLVEMDVLVAPQHVPFGNSFVRVWGVSLQDIGQASDLNFKNISVLGGMQKGLPLANPKQSGLLFQGTVQQAFGNWENNNQSLDFLVNGALVNTNGAPVASQGEPGNIVFNWAVGTPMAQALAATLRTAAPRYTQQINISSKLIYTETAIGFYQTFSQFAQAINTLSQKIIGGSYPGVNISIQQNSFVVADGTVAPPTIKQIAFTDLIGQVTWIAPGTIQARCVLRADIAVSDIVKLPQGQVATTAASLSQYRQGSIFQGQFMVSKVRHVGNSRQPDGNAWATILDCVGPVSATAS